MIPMTKLLTGERWCETVGVLEEDIMDLDGWATADAFYDLPIPYEDFRKRLNRCTMNIAHVNKAIAHYSQLSLWPEEKK